MSDIEIVDAIENLNESEASEKRQEEMHKLAEMDLWKNIEELQTSIKEKQERLKTLKIQKVCETKESKKRKIALSAQKRQRNAKQLKVGTQTESNS